MSAATAMFDLLFSATWKGSLLVALVLLLTHFLRGRMPARWAHALLLVALVRLLLPFAPASPLSVFNLLASRGETELLPALEPSRAGAFDRVPLRPKTPATPAPVKPLPWRPALLAVWGAGVLIAATRIALQSRAARRVAKNAEPLHDTTLLDECREQVGIRRRVRLAVSADIHAPALYGIVRPVLLLPHGFANTFTFEQLRFVFLHELAHLRRFDVLVNWIAAVVHALHWFNPLVRIAVSRLAEERELACDALALEHLGSSERGAYGGTLLRMLDQWRLPPPVPGLVGMTSAHHHVKRRIRMIATFRSESKRALWMALVLTIAVISLTDATAGEKRQFVILKEHPSPAAEAVIQKLDQVVSFELTGASIEDVIHAISNRTGVNVTAAEGAIDDAVRATKYNVLKADNVPAHIVLLESLQAAGLALRFDENGATILKMEEGEHRIMLRKAKEGEEGHERIFVRELSGKPGDADVMAFEHRIPRDGKEPAGELKFERRHPRPAQLELDAHEAGDGVVRRKVTLRGSEGGQAGGTFELEVQRDPASTPR